MALDDFRTWLDIGARDGAEGSIGTEAVGHRDALRAVVTDREGVAVEVELDYEDCGMLIDQLRAGMGVLLARHGNPIAAAAVLGRMVAADAAARMAAAAGAADTPPTSRS